MKLLSAFSDNAWSHIYSGWERDEHRIACSKLLLVRINSSAIEYIGKEESPLADKRYLDEREALFRQWLEDAHRRPRSWLGWWSE